MRPMYSEYSPEGPIRAPHGNNLNCRNWDCEGAMRMLMNNLDPQIANDWENLIVYGGSGRAARNWQAYTRIVEILKRMDDRHTLCIQSGKPVYIAPSHPEAPRVILANSNLVPHWSTQDHFDELDRRGLMMYGQMTAGSWIYIGTQGILQGTYETFAAAAKKEFGADSLKGRFILTAGLGGMSGAQPLAGTLNEAAILVVEARADRIERKVREGFCDRMTDSIETAITWIREAQSAGRPLSVGLIGNAAEVHPYLVSHDIIPDLVTDQTSAHDWKAYLPTGDVEDNLRLLESNPEEYRKRSYQAMAAHTQAILEMQKRGAVCFDYGNNLRAQAESAGVTVRNEQGDYLYPGFVPAYIRPLFCQGRGPFRWAALSGDPHDIEVLDDLVLTMFPDNIALNRWISLARHKVPQIGLPNRVCWLGYGERARFALAMNDLVHQGILKAPVVIGRDHLDTGSVASPNRETEAMLDGSDAVADWPLLNFALNSINGASWVSFHNGGGVGIGNSSHAGMVIVADGTESKARRLERVLTTDPGIGVARHYDAGYPEARETVDHSDIRIDHIDE
ncbi:MAG: urocanate hydratase [Candidatus Delongbacteria bacterium]|nr:urocanate hydratase [Candidatus Delongbacteria bacterium]